MQIQVHTDKNIEGDERHTDYVKSVVENAIERFSERISRVEVHLRDEHGNKPGQPDKRCLMEARVEGMQPMAVSHHAPSVGEAVDGAAEKLAHALESALGRLNDKHS